MANQTGLTLSQAKTMIGELDTLAKIVDKIEKKIISLRVKLLQALPAKYGSHLWWEKGISESLKDFEEGRYKTFKSVEELMRDLNS